MGVDDRTRDVELSVVMDRPAGDETPRELELSNAFERADDGEIFSLPDADRGQAWLFLASAVIFEAVTWGVFGMGL